MVAVVDYAHLAVECGSGPSITGRHGGGGKKRGEENLTKDTPPKTGFLDPLYNKPRLSRPEALLQVSSI